MFERTAKKLTWAFSLLFLLTFAGSLSLARTAVLPDPRLDDPQTALNQGNRSIVLAGGCFWGVQSVFQHVRGVTKVISGYSGGSAETASYQSVSTGQTGHAESVQITYDPTQITLGKILKVYFSVAHDPTELNYQGPDYGTQYRSAIFYANSEQKRITQTYIEQLNTAKIYSSPIRTVLEPLKGFYPAEDYHQNYAKRHPDDAYVALNDSPKVAHLEEQFPDLYVQ
jgi:peptide-methionine (S)-S-oxide reductase